MALAAQLADPSAALSKLLGPALLPPGRWGPAMDPLFIYKEGARACVWEGIVRGFCTRLD